MKTLTMRFGVLADPVEAQVRDQGFDIDETAAGRLDAYATGIASLRLAGLLTDAEAKKANARLYRMVCHHAKETP